MTYLIRKWWLRRNIRICNGIEHWLREDLKRNERARRRYEELLVQLETDERHKVINAILENTK